MYFKRQKVEIVILETGLGGRFDATNIIKENLHRSPLYSGMIEGIGPRYCPSIEDKVNRFADKERHQLFVEPCGKDTEEMYFFELHASNGEKLLSSEEYTTYAGALRGIQTHKTNIEKGNFRISLTKRGDYIYKLLNGNGQLLCLGEHYKTKRRCQNAVESVTRFAFNSPVLTSEKTKKN